jgi:hypothetical protein
MEISDQLHLCTPMKHPQIFIEQEAGWAPESVVSLPKRPTDLKFHETGLKACMECLEKSRFIWRNILSVYGEEAPSDSCGFHDNDARTVSENSETYSISIQLALREPFVTFWMNVYL